jgi:hypothetical protein
MIAQRRNQKEKVACAKTEGTTRKVKWTNILKEPDTPTYAYNLYFKEKRVRLLGTKCTLVLRLAKKKSKQQAAPYGVISCHDLPKHVDKTWRELPSKDKRKYCMDTYAATKKQYKKEMEACDEAVQNAMDCLLWKRARTISVCAKNESSNDAAPDVITSSTSAVETANDHGAVIVIDDYISRGTGRIDMEEECKTEESDRPKPAGTDATQLIDNEKIEPIKLEDICSGKDQEGELSSADMQLVMDALDASIQPMQTAGMQIITPSKSMMELEEDLQYVLEEFRPDVPDH